MKNSFCTCSISSLMLFSFWRLFISVVEIAFPYLWWLLRSVRLILWLLCLTIAAAAVYFLNSSECKNAHCRWVRPSPHTHLDFSNDYLARTKQSSISICFKASLSSRSLRSLLCSSSSPLTDGSGEERRYLELTWEDSEGVWVIWRGCYSLYSSLYRQNACSLRTFPLKTLEL